MSLDAPDGPHPSQTPIRRRMWQDLTSAVRGTDPPTVEFVLPGKSGSLSQHQARAVIDVALRVADAMLVTGASASDVVATVLRLTAAYGVTTAHVDVTFTSITISIHRGLDEDPLTVLRVVRNRSTDYTRLQNVELLVDRVAQAAPGAVPDIADVRADLERILKAPRPYRHWVVTLGNALMGAGVVLLFGGAPLTIVVSGLSAALVHQATRRMGQWGFATFFVQLVGAAIPTAIAVLLHWAKSMGWDLPIQNPSLVAIAGIVVLLAGLTVVGSAQDAIDGYYVTATARILEVLMLTVGIAVGIALVLGLAQRFGISVDIVQARGTPGGLWALLAASGMVGAGFAASTHTRPRAALLASLTAMVVAAIWAFVVLLNVAEPVAVATAAVAAGAVGYTAHARLRMPEPAVTTAAIVTLLPGFAVFRGLDLIITQGRVNLGLGQLVSAVGTGLGIAAGISIGTYIARRVNGQDRAAMRAAASRQPYEDD